MIYQDIKRYLKRNLQKPSKEQAWGGHDNFVFLNFLQGRYSDDEIEKNVAEIKQAFRDFFEPVGSIIFRFKLDTGVAFIITPYHVEPKDSRHLKKLIEIIRSNRRYIEYPYQGREDQIALKGKIRRAINAEIIETDEAVSKKELTRYAIRTALELEEQDVIVQLKRKYIIKIFQKNVYLNNTAPEPKPKDGAERRFEGYNRTDLTNHYNELLEEIEIEAFLDNVMALLFAGKLNFREIDNNYYEKHVLSLVRQTIAQELANYVSDNKNYLLGFAGYIFRNNFESVHQRIAIELFELVSVKDSNAQKFLNYYSGEIYIENGKRYAIPEIKTPDDKRWNITSITAIATMWLRSRDQLDKYRAQHENISRHFVDLADSYEKAEKEFKELEKKVKVLTKQFNEIETNIQDHTKRFKSEIKGEMNEKRELELASHLKYDKQTRLKLKQQIVSIQPEKDNARYRYKGMESQYMDLKKKKQELESEIRNLKQNLDINSDSFHAILGSFVKALMQRKKLIDSTI
jgi:hypothetical protein